MNPFSAILGIGASFGLLRVIQTVPSSDRFRWLIAALVSLLGALLGARAGFLIAYSAYYQTHTQEILQITQGGLSWPGALAGAILFAWIMLTILKLPRLAGLDQLCRMLLPLSVALWLGGWQAGIAYGQLLPGSTWWGMLTTDDSGMTALRVPVQPTAVVSLIVLLGFGEWIIRRVQKPGLKSGILGCVLTLHTLLFSLMRDDPIQRYLGLRLDSWAAALFLAITLFYLLVILIRKGPKNTKEVTEMEI